MFPLIIMIFMMEGVNIIMPYYNINIKKNKIFNYTFSISLQNYK